jgi:hypothetical protein
MSDDEPGRALKLRWLAGVICAAVVVGTWVPAGVVVAKGYWSDKPDLLGHPWGAPYAKPTVIVDLSGAINSELCVQLIRPEFEHFKNMGYQVGAYLNFGTVENDATSYDIHQLYPDLAARARMYILTVDGPQPVSSFNFSIMRPGMRDYIIQGSKRAIDAGATFLVYDLACPPPDSFDPESIEGFRQFLEDNQYTAASLGLPGETALDTFDYAAYVLDVLGYREDYGAHGCDSPHQYYLRFPPLDDPVYQAWVRYVYAETARWYEQLSRTLHDYAASNATAVKLTANAGPLKDQSTAYFWAQMDIWDVLGAETIMKDAYYPLQRLTLHYRLGAAWGKPFWNWDPPATKANTQTGGTVRLTEAARLAISEIYAAGGIAQVVHQRHDNNGLLPDDHARVMHREYAMLEAYPEVFGQSLVENGVGLVHHLDQTPVDDGRNVEIESLSAAMFLADAHLDYTLVGEPNREALTDPTHQLTPESLAKYAVIVVPDRGAVTTAEAELLRQWMELGGKRLIVMGWKQGVQALEDLLGVANNQWNEYSATESYGIRLKDHNMNSYWGEPLANRETIVDSFLDLVGDYIKPTVQGTSHIRDPLRSTVNIYRTKQTDVDGSEIYNFVNFSWSFDETTGTETVVDTAEATVTLPIPSGWEGKTGDIQITWVTPETVDSPQTLSYTLSGDRLMLTVPSFHLWGVMKVGSTLTREASQNRYPITRAAREENLQAIYFGTYPETLDVGYSSAYDNMYNSGPIMVEFDVRDDKDLTGGTVTLYYRHRPTESDPWSEWTAYTSPPEETAHPSPQTLVGAPDTKYTAAWSGNDRATGAFAFYPPEGSGQYEVFARATDAEGLQEPMRTGKQWHFAYDTTNPPYPSEVIETNGVQTGVWQTAVTAPTFSWDVPSDWPGVGQFFLLIQDFDTHFTILEEVINSWDGDTVTWTPSFVPEMDSSYSLTVQVRDLAGNIAGEAAEMFVFRYGTAPVPRLINPQVTVGSGCLNIAWENPADMSNVRCIVVQSRPVGGFTWSGTGPVEPSETEHTLPAVNGTPYYVRVFTVANDPPNIQGDYQVLTNGGEGYTPGDSAAPAAPVGLVAEAGDGSVTLSWTANTEPDVVGYRVYRDGTLLTPSLVTGTSYTDNGVQNGTVYTYTLTAVDTSGNESPASAEVRATPNEFVGDLNGDGQVNEIDLAVLASSLRSRAVDGGWNPAHDLDGDGVIGILDVVLLARSMTR